MILISTVMKKHIIIEWIHWSWKTSVAQALAEKLQAKYVHFPDENDQLWQVIRQTVADPRFAKCREITGLLYISFSNRFHIQTRDDGITYVQDRDSVSTGLVFQSEIPRETRLQLYHFAIENLQNQWIVIYVKTDLETAKSRMENRNKILMESPDLAMQNKAKDQFIAENFINLSLRYEKEMIEWLDKMGIPHFTVSNNGTIEKCIEEILKQI